MPKKNKSRKKLLSIKNQKTGKSVKHKALIDTACQSILGLFQRGHVAEALKQLQQAAALYPQATQLWRLAVMLYASTGHLAHAEAAANKVLSLQVSAEAYYDLALVKQHQNCWVEAETALRQAIHKNPQFAEAYNNLGLVLYEQHHLDEAINAYRQSIHYKPTYARAYTNLGCALKKARKFSEACEMHRHALKLQPGFAGAYNNLAGALNSQGKHEEALSTCQKAIQLKPDVAEAYNTLANTFAHLEQDDKALAAYQQAIALKPDLAEAHNSLAVILGKQEHLMEANVACREALCLQPDLFKTLAMLTHNLQKICAWQEWQSLSQQLIQATAAGKDYEIAPFAFMSLSDDPALQQICARHHAAREIEPFKPSSPVSPVIHQHGKLRIAYLSADFRKHPIAYVIAEVFELHDRNRFEVIAYSVGPDDDSDIGKRIKAGFDRFEEVKTLSIEQLAARIRADKIDILVDLTGYTSHNRSAVLALRPAPVQVQYLGYPGTLGTRHVDYVIADKTIIPQKDFEFFNEKVVWMPDTYQSRDRQCPIAERPTRSEAGLPEQGFVWCCFNNSYKITPEVFSLWMRLLQAEPGSVLWLAENNSWMAANLRREAQNRGVDPGRLIFAHQLPLEEHLARVALADLFLDTLTYNAHATMSDTLWAGVPAISCMGQSLASRVGTSLLQAVGLPELITDNLQDYENLALSLARNPDKLAAIKHKLESNRDSCALFNTPMFVKHLETAYEMMWARAKQGLPPAHIQVPSAPGN
ncbi:tetratricopeptide repeat protein [Candidatus Venteria ishoeyi]|uniref:tetratricopeptide repeat protein n=1 Tax=Candidatus Venteria ishoeyi TaxID=1899563 RepID=UPI0025A5F0BA|nr:tetratricopeptide repeat protein [Candidatus Venteria ishoeyi]MDM8548380.1 tetratricopeptide repeat protein [Candidatus Venteria ishoeyi]